MMDTIGHRAWRGMVGMLAVALLALAVGCKQETAGPTAPVAPGPTATTTETAGDGDAGDGELAPETTEYGTTYPGANWKDRRDPLASPFAVPGGEFTLYFFQEPQSYNNYLDNFYHTAVVFGAMYDTLLGGDSVTLEDRPNLVSQWAISDDKLTFTFWLDPNATWSDGSPITAADIKATYDAVMASDKTVLYQVSYKRFDSPTIIDERTFQFKANEVHWQNLDVLGGIQPMPKKLLDEKGLDNILFDFPVISGPYRIKERKTGQFMVMEKRDDWWQAGYLRNQNTLNFKTFRCRFYADPTNALEAFKKGDLDLYEVNMSKIWVQESVGERFDKNWIVKQRVFNFDPPGFQGWALNMRREQFADRRVRLALWHTVNRELMNKQYAYGVYTLHQSYYPDLYDAEHPNPNPYIAFDLDKARALFKEAGWAVNPETGLLQKDGKNFVIKVMTRDSSADNYWNMWRQDLKSVGVTLEIEQRDLAVWTKAMDEFEFDVAWTAFGAAVKKNPEPMWSSEYADQPTSLNYTGFRNDRVDALIEQQKSEFDITKRNDMVREIDQIVYAEVPYMLLWNTNNARLLYWNKFGTPDWVLSKYGNGLSALTYWWADPDAAAALQDAMQNNTALPDKPDDVYFDKTFHD